MLLLRKYVPNHYEKIYFNSGFISVVVATQRKFTSQNVETRLQGNKLVFKNNGNIYIEKVFVPRAEDIINCDEEECQKLKQFPTV